MYSQSLYVKKTLVNCHTLVEAESFILASLLYHKASMSDHRKNNNKSELIYTNMYLINEDNNSFSLNILKKMI